VSVKPPVSNVAPVAHPVPLLQDVECIVDSRSGHLSETVKPRSTAVARRGSDDDCALVDEPADDGESDSAGDESNDSETSDNDDQESVLSRNETAISLDAPSSDSAGDESTDSDDGGPGEDDNGSSSSSSSSSSDKDEDGDYHQGKTPKRVAALLGRIDDSNPLSSGDSLSSDASDGDQAYDDDDDDDDAFCDDDEEEDEDEKEDTEDNEPDLYYTGTPYVSRRQRVPLDEALLSKAYQNTLTLADLDAADPTDVLRLAVVPIARPLVERWWGHALRGLPMGRRFTLLPHQLQAIGWMREREALPVAQTYGVAGGLLSATMGMGKTVMALGHTLMSPRGDYPTLVICSKSVMHEWHTKGVSKFFGTRAASGAFFVNVLYLHQDFMSPADIRRLDRQALARYDLVITTYDVCQAECRRGGYADECVERSIPRTSAYPVPPAAGAPKKAKATAAAVMGRVIAVHARSRRNADLPRLTGTALIYGTPWERVICDESHRFANPSTALYRAMMAIYGRYKWCLTGTPVRNQHTDIWAQLRFLGYTAVPRRAVWTRQGPALYARHHLDEAVLVMGHQHLEQGKGDTGAGADAKPSNGRDNGQRDSVDNNGTDKQPKRGKTKGKEKKKEFDATIPPLTEQDILVTLSDRERITYDAVLSLTRRSFTAALANAGQYGCVVAYFTRLRQAAVAPHVMTMAEHTATGADVMRALCESHSWDTSVAVPEDDDASRAVALPALPAQAPPVAPVVAPGPAVPAVPVVLPIAPYVYPNQHVNGRAPQRQRSDIYRTVVIVVDDDDKDPNPLRRAKRDTAIDRSLRNDPTGSHVPTMSDAIRQGLAARNNHLFPTTPTPTVTEPLVATGPVVRRIDYERRDVSSEDDAREASLGPAVWCADRWSRAGARSAKMRAAMRVLKRIPPGEKVIVFSSFVACLRLLADVIAARLPDMGVVVIDGETPKKQRADNLRHFRNANRRPRVMLMTYTVGSEGIDLTVANHCICIEPWWTGIVHEQACARCWRMGQTRPVTVYNLIAQDTIDERIMAMCRQKAAIADTYLADSARTRRGAAAAAARRRRRNRNGAMDMETIARILGQ